ncbi:15672_t:CDS:2 [Funneliformis geosporum]|uniref:15672_t:CDS:1 n=1 Tax=Funneliformis geosporum TaxID=1117311 RepID=A0A9W4SJF3_9GLOM|nr:15672_t:CDS:2 [Funneliformis geosporum]
MYFEKVHHDLTGSLGIIHRDFHSGNILCNSEYDVVISDLGISKLSTEASVNENGYYGIIPYIAPEIFQGQKSNKYTEASDIYSFGMIMWELMIGRRPFWDQNYDTELIIKICDDIRPSIITTNAPEGYIELMQKCWHSDPKKRPTTRAIRESVKKIISNEKKNPTKIINSIDIGPTSKVTTVTTISAESTRSLKSRSIFGKRKFEDSDNRENIKKAKSNDNDRNGSNHN